MAQLSYEEVLGAANKLLPEEQRRLREELESRERSRYPNGIKDLRGFGTEVSRDPKTGNPIDAQEYVRRERESWLG